jgi:hypothetical protein
VVFIYEHDASVAATYALVGKRNHSFGLAGTFLTDYEFNHGIHLLPACPFPPVT